MIRIAPALLSLLLFAASSLRRGDWGLTAALAALCLLAISRKDWLRPVLTAALAWGFVMWIETASTLVNFRLVAGMPWMRLAAIMGGVMLLNLAAMVLLHSGKGRAWFSQTSDWPGPRAAAFILTAALLALTRAKTPFPVLLADRFLPGSGFLEILGLAYYASWAVAALREPKDARKLRPRFWAAFSAVFFAQLALGLLGVHDMLMTGRLHLPVPALILGGPLYRGGGLFMPILFGVSVLLVGPAWCSWLCYIGAWDDQSSRLLHKLPKAAPGRMLWYGRGASLALTVAGALGLRAAGVPGLPAVLVAAVFGLAGVGVMILLSRRRGYMVHCTSFCPMGLVGNLLGRLSPWRLTIAAGCTRCGACSRVCRYGALTAADLAANRPGLSCTLCGDCLPACKESHLGYRLPRLSPPQARAIFLVMVVALHAVFLGVARI